MEDKLLPCPFCGSVAKVHYIERLGEKRYRVICDSQNCWGMTTDCDSRSSAIQAWNHRPTEDALRVENALLKAQPGKSLVLRCGELEAELAKARENADNLSRACRMAQAELRGDWLDGSFDEAMDALSAALTQHDALKAGSTTDLPQED